MVSGLLLCRFVFFGGGNGGEDEGQGFGGFLRRQPQDVGDHPCAEIVIVSTYGTPPVLLIAHFVSNYKGAGRFVSKRKQIIDKA